MVDWQEKKLNIAFIGNHKSHFVHKFLKSYFNIIFILEDSIDNSFNILEYNKDEIPILYWNFAYLEELDSFFDFMITKKLTLFNQKNNTLPTIGSKARPSSKISLNELEEIDSLINTSNFISAWRLLQQKQIKYPDDRKILIRISKILEDDNKINYAYIFLRILSRRGFIKDLVNLFLFEVKYSYKNAANETLDKILSFDIDTITPYMRSLNVASGHIEELSSKLVIHREQINNHLKKTLYKNQLIFNKSFPRLMALRGCVSHNQTIENIKTNNIKLNNNLTNYSKKVDEFICLTQEKIFLLWIELAHKNESFNNLWGIKNGKTVKIEDINNFSEFTVEVFIIPHIFSDPNNPNNSTTRIANLLTFFLKIYLFLMQQNDIIIIPRHQYYSRLCFPKTKNKIISYHTISQKNIKADWVHIQDSTFSGYCSVDKKGFAGFADIATNFNKIDLYTLNVPQKILENNFEELVNKFINKDISKYVQNNEIFKSKQKYVFIAMQVLTDVVSKLAYINGIELLNIISKFYYGSNIKVVVKRHPLCKSISIEQTINKLESLGYIEVSTASIHSLISGSEAVFTVNSGVGLESLLHMKPVIATGECEYAYATQAVAKTKKELLKLLKKNNFFVDKQKILKFLFYYIEFYVHDLATIEQFLVEWIKRD